MSNRSSVLPSSVVATQFTALLPSVGESMMGTKRRSRLTSVEAIELAREQAEKAGFQVGVERGHTVGFLEGFEEGKRQGRDDAYNEALIENKAAMDQFTSALDATLRKINEEIPRWFEESEQAMTDLAIKAVRRILSAELTLSRDSALEIVKEALEDVTHSRHARIRLNPFDSAILEQHRTELMAAAGSLRDVELVADPSIAGGCVIETDGGVVDATVETKIILLEQELREAA
ncbi:MAG TPA: FliH/SctL family protein [Fimbriimonas sp.]|nr:FliH/SctL family protein [Fimbriimonas sp.]